MGELDPRQFTIHRAEVREGVELAYIREGVGGVPLLLIHGWPSTKRIFWRNIQPLADAGFEVIVPDQRGFGDSPLHPDGVDIVATSRDVQGLMTTLGHERCVVAAGDFGGAIAQDLAHRFPDLVIRQVIYNGSSPVLPELYEAQGVTGNQLEEVAAASEHLMLHALEADRLAAELDTAQKRHDYVKSFYNSRPLAGPQGFDDAAADFMAEPFADAKTFRASLRLYEALFDDQMTSEPVLLEEPNVVETMILYGVEDTFVGPKFTRRMEIATPHRVGPFLIERSGHFVQFERPDIFNAALVTFCRDLLQRSSRSDAAP